MRSTWTRFWIFNQNIVELVAINRLTASFKVCNDWIKPSIVQIVFFYKYDIFYFEGLDGGQVTIYPDFIRRCILFVENVGDYQVKQHSEKLVEVCLSRRDEQVETAITEQFRLLAQQKEFKEAEIQFSDYHWDISRKLKRIQRL